MSSRVRGGAFFKLLDFKACQPAFNQFGVGNVGMYVMFWLLDQTSYYRKSNVFYRHETGVVAFFFPLIWMTQITLV